MKRARVFIFVGTLWLAFSSWAQKLIFPKPLSPRIANYKIQVRLEPKTRTIYGKEVLVWHNKTSFPAKELWFHLYLNAFRNDQSTFMKESGARWGKKMIKKDGWGYIEVNRIQLASGADLTDRIQYIHPDDDNEQDKTVFRLPLSKPVKPKEKIELKIEFTAKLPSPPFARSGAWKDFFFVAQWFPKIGVFENGRWNCHQYHRNTEFYADFGVYEVEITVPENYIVGATGLKIKKINNQDGTATHIYYAEDVHDFVWTASPNFVEFKGRAQDVEIRVLMQKGHKAQGKRFLEAGKIAVKYFQEHFGDYPYPNLTIVDPPKGARGAGGMEYPTLITSLTFLGVPKKFRLPEVIIIHEFGHQYWYHIIASNEFEEPWLDEGINTYCEIRIMKDVYGKKANLLDWKILKVDDLQERRFAYLEAPDYDPLFRAGWKYYSPTSYRANAYSKTALLLLTLENYIGKEKMDEILRTYFEQYKFKHPHTEDFLRIVNQLTDNKFKEFLNDAFHTNWVLDYSVDWLSCQEVKEPKGYDYTLSVSGEVSKAERKAEANKSKEKLYQCEVRIRRLGGLKFPVEIEVAFANGKKVLEKWDGEELWKIYRYTEPAKLNYVQIDPEEKIPLDINWKNNRKTLRKQIREDKTRNETLEMIKFLLNPH